MVESGVIEDYTYLWYDVRPHPNFGTVEIRAMDAQTRVEHTLGARRAHPGDGQGARRALRGGQAARPLPVRDARREQVAGRAPRAGGRAGRPAGARRVPRQGARAAALRPAARARRRTSDRPTSSRRSRTSWSNGNGAHRQRVVYEANHDYGEVMRRSSRRRARRRVRGGSASRPRRIDGPWRADPDLFVVCKNCGSEVSPYITECPYCGTRLRKRAPKLERGGERQGAEAPAPAPHVARAACEPGEIPGIRGRAAARTPRSRSSWSSLVCHARLRAPGCGRRRRRAARPDDDGRVVPHGHHAVLLHAAPATRSSRSAPIFLFGWLLERRHGPWAPLLRVLRRRRGRQRPGDRRRRRRHRHAGRQRRRAGAARRPGRCATCSAAAAAIEDDSDLLGALAIAARPGRCCRWPSTSASALAGLGGGLIGVILGSALARPACATRSDPTADRARLARDEPADDARRRSRPRAPAARRRAGRRRSSRRTPAAGAPRARRRPSREGLGVGAVAPRAAGERARRSPSSSSTPSIAGTAAASISAATPLAAASSCRWPSRPKPVTSVSACAPAARACSAARSLSVVMTSTAALHQRGVRQPALDRGRDGARAERLGEHERVAGAAAGVGEHVVRGAPMPVTAIPYLGSGSSIEWPPTIGAPAAAAASAPPRRISRSTSGAERLERVGDEVERGDRRRAHRVDVRQRVGGGDAAERVRVVDDRREEVDGLHDRQVVGELDDAGVVGRVGGRRARAGRSGAGGAATIGRRSAADSLQPHPAPWDREVRGDGHRLL